MIKFIHKGHKISIRNDDWRELRTRFNPDNAEWGYMRERYEIRIGCSLCDRYRIGGFHNECGKKCPLYQFGSETQQGCYVFIDSILKGIKFRLSVNAIYWYKRYNPEVCNQLRILLKQMGKIEKEQK